MISQQYPTDSDITLSILLVEDNPLNQQLTTAILNAWGHTVEVASNGKEALALHCNGKYDLILMDLQMPVMDGYEATKKIRDREKYSPYHVTIIAMTANPPAYNREKCMSIGMDGYFSKPFTVEKFHVLIKKYQERLHPMVEKTCDTDNDRIAAVTTTTPFSYAAALKQVDPIIVSMMAKPLLNELPQQLLTMRRSWEKHNWAIFQRAAHILSTLLGVFNAEPAQHIASEIDRSLRNRHTENILVLFEKLKYEIDLFSEQLRWYEIS